MATLYVENVPDDIYKALRKRAKANRKSIAAEVIALLEQQIPTDAELKRRRKIFDRIWPNFEHVPQLDPVLSRPLMR